LRAERSGAWQSRGLLRALLLTMTILEVGRENFHQSDLDKGDAWSYNQIVM